jgi:hypothetical protein
MPTYIRRRSSSILPPVDRFAVRQHALLDADQEHVPEFQALGGVQGGELHRIARSSSSLSSMDISATVCVSSSRTCLFLALAPQPVDEVAHIGPARFRLARLELFEQPGFVADGAAGPSSTLPAGASLRARHSMRLMKSPNSRSGVSCLAGSACSSRFRTSPANRLMWRAGVGAERFQAWCRRCRGGRGDGADEGRVVVAGWRAGAGRHDVLDLGAVEEGLAAGDDVGNLLRAQLLLDDARLVVAAVEDGVVGKLAAVLELVRRCAWPRIRLRARRRGRSGCGSRRPGRARTTASFRTAWGCWRSACWRPQDARMER